MRKGSFAAILALSACFSVFICFISGGLGSRFVHHDEVVYNQQAILRGAPHHIDGADVDFPQFQSRILFPLLLQTLQAYSGLSASKAYLALRMVTAGIAFFSFMLLCVVVGNIPLRLAGIGAGVLAYMLVFTFNHPWEHPTDFPDIAFVSLFLWSSLRHQRMFLMLATLLATLNHQTAAFSSVIWLALWGWRAGSRTWLEGAFAGALVIASYILSTAIKMSFGTSSATQSVNYVINGWLTIQHFFEALRTPGPGSWPLLLMAMITPVWLWLYSNRVAVTGDVRRLVIAAISIVVLSSPIAYWSEIRSVFLTPMVVLIFGATLAEAKREGQNSAGH